MKQFSLLLAAALLSLPAVAQPVIASLGVRNGASYALPPLPNSSIAQGSIFIVFGQNLGPAKIVQVSSFPLPTSEGLSGTSIQVTVNGTTVNAIMLYTLATQVAAVLPSTTPVGTGNLTVTYNGQISASAPITVVPSSFGIFSVNQSGSGPGVLQNVKSESDRPFNSPTQSAQPGQVMILWGTGLGPVSGDERSGPLPGDMTKLNIHVWVGNKEAQIQYRGRSGCCTGDDQIVFVVPSGLEGCFLPVYVQIDNVTSNFVTMSIGNNGAACSDPGLSEALIEAANKNGGLRAGSLFVGRSDGEAGDTHQQSENIGAGFTKIPLALIYQGQSPTFGLCVVTQFPSATPPLPSYLDAGKVSVSTPGGPYDLPQLGSQKGLYNLSFVPGATGIPGVIGDGTQLKPGTYTFTGTGGADVGPFTASIDYPRTFQWNHDAVTSVDRSKPLVLTWTGGTPGALASANGQSSGAPGSGFSGDIGAAFVCWADAAAGSMTIPVAVLSALPPSYLDDRGHPQGSLYVQEGILNKQFSASGLDYGTIFFSDGYSKGRMQFK